MAGHPLLLVDDRRHRRRQQNDKRPCSGQIIRSKSLDATTADYLWCSTALLDPEFSTIERRATISTSTTSRTVQHHKEETFDQETDRSRSSSNLRHSRRGRERHPEKQHRHRRSKSCDNDSNNFIMSGSTISDECQQQKQPSSKTTNSSSSARRSSSGTEKPMRRSDGSSRHHNSSSQEEGHHRSPRKTSAEDENHHHHHSRSSSIRRSPRKVANDEEQDDPLRTSPSSKHRSSSKRLPQDGVRKSDAQMPPSMHQPRRDRHSNRRGNDETRDNSPASPRRRGEQQEPSEDDDVDHDENDHADDDVSCSPSVACKRRDAAQRRGTEVLSPKRHKEVKEKHTSSPGQANDQYSHNRGARRSNSSRDSESQTPCRSRRPTIEHTTSGLSSRTRGTQDHGSGLSSRTRATQTSDKRNQWKEKKKDSKATNTKPIRSGSSYDDDMDEKVQRRQSMLDTSKKGTIRATASRSRAHRDVFADRDESEYNEYGYGDDDDDDDNGSVYSTSSYLTTDSDLMSDPHMSLAVEMQRRQSCSYLPAGLGATPHVPKAGRRASAFGNSQDRAKAVYNNLPDTKRRQVRRSDNDSDDSDEESMSVNQYIPSGLSRNCNFDVDRADQSGARRPSMSCSSSQLTVPNVAAPVESSTPNRALLRSSTNTSGGSGMSGGSGSSFSNRRGSVSGITLPAVDAPPARASRRASTMGDAGTSSRHDKGLEDILKNRRLRGDNSLARNRYAQEEKEEEQKRLVDPLKMLSTVGTAGIKGLTTVTNVGFQGVCTVGNAGLNVSKQTVKGISTVGTAGIKGVSAVGNAGKQTVHAGIKGVSVVGNAGLNTVNAGIKGVSAVGNVGLNVTKQTAKGLSTASRKGVKGVSDTILQRSHEPHASTALVESS